MALLEKYLFVTANPATRPTASRKHARKCKKIGGCGLMTAAAPSPSHKLHDGCSISRRHLLYLPRRGCFAPSSDRRARRPSRHRPRPHLHRLPLLLFPQQLPRPWRHLPSRDCLPPSPVVIPNLPRRLPSSILRMVPPSSERASAVMKVLKER